MTSLCYCASAQTVLDIPAKISFADWKLVEQNVLTTQYSIEFPSPVVSETPANDSLNILVLVPKIAGQPVPAVVLLHYWGATDHRVELNFARELARKGIASVIMPLPYHMNRSPEGVRSGSFAISADPNHIIRTMLQAIMDLKRTADWIQTRQEFRHDRIGISGASLGAVITALASSVEPRFTDAAFVVGGADLAHLLWHSSRVVLQRDTMRSKGITEQSLREILKPIEPLEYFKNHRPMNSYVIGAKFDTVIPQRSVDHLIDGLEKPHTLWLETGHYGGFLIEKQVQRSLGDFFSKSFADQTFVAPSKLSAPTIRLGVTLDTKGGAQISAGIDLLRPNWPREPFASILFQPSSTQLVLGVSLDNGLAVGAFIRQKGIGFGMMWSMIL